MIHHANTKQKRAGVVILILDKLDFEIKNITRDTEIHHNVIGDNSPRRYNNVGLTNSY